MAIWLMRPKTCSQRTRIRLRSLLVASIELNFTKVASQFRLSLRQARSLDPQEAFTRLLEAKGFDATVIEDVWMALTSTDLG